VDGTEGSYEIIRDPIFSPNSRRVAYEALLAKKLLIVVDGTEKKAYDGILSVGWKGTASISLNSLHYLARIGNRYYVVEESIQ